MDKNKYHYSLQIWTEERKNWLVENTKGLGRQEAYDLFCKAFPELKTTNIAVNNMRSRLRCAMYTCKHGSTKSRPLYSEREKKGYIFIKVAQPSVWWSKAKFVYVATHPEEAGDFLETDAFYFYDGNNRNFNPNNIFLVHRREQAVFINEGGIVKDNPEQTRINLLQARLKLAQLDALEKIPGEVVISGNTRLIREERNRKQRERIHTKYTTDPEWRRNYLEKRKQYEANKKANDPEYSKRRKEYARNWAREKRRKQNENSRSCTNVTSSTSND